MDRNTFKIAQEITNRINDLERLHDGINKAENIYISDCGYNYENQLGKATNRMKELLLEECDREIKELKEHFDRL